MRKLEADSKKSEREGIKARLTPGGRSTVPFEKLRVGDTVVLGGEHCEGSYENDRGRGRQKAENGAAQGRGNASRKKRPTYG